MIAPVRITGLGHALPEKVIDNIELEKLVETSDEWIRKRTGIAERHLITDESVVSLACSACRKAINTAGIDSKDVGIIIASTISSDYLTPSLASLVQKELGIPLAASFDISAGCSGFIYALTMAASLMDSLNVDKALVVASEAMSRYTDWTDRSTCVLFGDGAGAVVIERCTESALHFPCLKAIPDEKDVLYVENIGIKTPFVDQKADGREKMKIRMDGHEVFIFATSVMLECLEQLQEQCGDQPYNKIITHQANIRINDYIARKTKYNIEQFYINVDKFANTSSASIVIAMDQAYREGWLKKGDRIALVAFGAGLAWGGVVLDWTMEDVQIN